VSTLPTPGSGLDETARAEMRELMARYPDPRSALLPMLHLVQSYEGYVTPEGIEVCAAELGLSEAEVAGVATFYTMFKRHPMGDYHVGVCTNTLCAVMGGDAIWDRVSGHLGIGHDEVTDDGRVSLERVECNAACDYAPVVMVNWEFVDRQSPDTAVALVDALRGGEPVQATRGARICTFKQAERVIAGFSDGLAGQGPAAGDASLRGLLLAREKGWEAPAHPEPSPPAAPVEEVAVDEAVHSARESGGPEQPPAGPPPATTVPSAANPPAAQPPEGDPPEASRPAAGTSGSDDTEKETP
jgi:NADH-quinone oxidoreductase subunit E